MKNRDRTDISKELCMPTFRYNETANNNNTTAQWYYVQQNCFIENRKDTKVL